MISEHSAGKGPTARKVNGARYRDNFDAIDWGSPELVGVVQFSDRADLVRKAYALAGKNMAMINRLLISEADACIGPHFVNSVHSV